MKSNLETIFNVVIGTAGHIDHGKSTLVERLTGVDPDRLPEEKERGLTIDLGFAPLKLRDGRRVGIVDVPGHERLIKNMVAGATGIDLVLLVVAADDGVMPQTREHLTIMEILGLAHGLVAITKVDLVDEDLRELVREEISEALAGTFLERAPIVEVSSTTGEGLDLLLESLHASIANVKPRETGGVFRMPIQRVFSPKGFGTVVTGIPISGSARVGDTLEVVPLGKTGRVRGIHAYKEVTDLARAGHSTALNLSDIDYRQVSRGMVVTQPGYFSAADMFEARLRYLPQNVRPLIHQTPIRLHVGTAEALGRVHLLERKALEPGEESFVQFRLDEPVVAAPGDRFVLRLYSPLETIGGGTILDRSHWRLKTGKQYVIENLSGKQRALGDAKRSLVQMAASEAEGVVSEKDLSVGLGLPLDDVRGLVAALVDAGELLRADRPGIVIARRRLDAARARAREVAEKYYAENPLRLHMEKAMLRQTLSCHDLFLDEMLAALSREGEIEVAGGQLRWRDFGPRLSDGDREVCDEIESSCLESKFTPPSPAELAATHGWSDERAAELFDLLVEEGRLQRIADGIYFHRDAVEEARCKLREHLVENGSTTASDAKKLFGSTRKYLIPLLEQFDREGLTVRRGDLRVLKS